MTVTGNLTTHTISGLGGEHSRGLSIGDFDGDGDMDLDVLMFVNPDSKMMILLNDGSGNFTTSASIPRPGDCHQSRTTDLDGDRDIDIVTINYNYINDGAGNFTMVNNPLGFQTNDIMAGDYDRDGDMDVSQSNGISEQLQIYKNNGTGTLSNFNNVDLFSYPSDMTSADFDSDGDIDIVQMINPTNSNGNVNFYVIMNDYSGPPQVTSLSPLQNAISVNKSSDITVTFDQDMNASTLNSTNIKVFGFQTGLKSSSVSYNSGTKTATINPTSDFKVGEKIQVTLSSGIQSSSNIPITPFTWTFTVQALSGTGVFTETVIDTAGAGTIGGMDLVCGDFNGDNKNDLAAINYGGDTYIYTNTGNGNFSVTQVISVSGLTVGGGLTAGDFDSDGDLDLLMSFYNPTEQYFVYMNDGNGNFTLSSSGTPGIYYCETADLDNDGDLDVVGMWYGTELRYLINDGTGNFTPHSIPGKDFTREICDVENDGDLDIICANGVIGTATGITVLINDGNANFSVGNTAVGSSIVWYASAQDYDSDGDMDIVSNEVIFLNDGSGNFSSSFSPGIGFTLVSGDFDADGDIDNAFSENADDDIEIFKNNSSAVFTTSQIVSVGNSPGWSTSCDFDEDGDIDIAVANYLGHSGQSDISILKNDLNCTPPPCGITGSDFVLPGSINNIFIGSTPNGYWGISNYDNTLATIPEPSNGDTLRLSAGLTSGHFALYFTTPDGCGGLPFCSKNVYVEDPNAINCNVTAIIEGFYNVSLNKLNMRDTMKAYLRNTSLPYSVVDSAVGVIDSVNFTGGFLFRNAPTGTYIIVLKHRNAIETWSSGGVDLVRGTTRNYDFTSSQSQAYGNNLLLKGSRYCIYSGDVNHDRIIDAQDLSLVDNDALNYTIGYVSTDITGNRTVDAADLSVVDNNALNYVAAQIPAGSDSQEFQSSKSSRTSELSKSGELLNDVPEKYELKDNYPNPFNPTTNIKYDLPVSGFVSLKIFDITGREVANLVNENKNAGRFSVEWNASQFASGTYFYKIVAGEFSQVKRMILIK